MAVEKLQVYRCEICGMMTEVVREGNGALICCGKPMTHVEGNVTEAATEKHIPVIEKVEGGVKVTVGSVVHPMGFDHFIEWIEVIVDGKAYREFLKPTGTPEAFFAIDGDKITVLAYCNLHGLWQAEM
ncbi:MAG: desulfoferrodoxin [bacterium]|nr:desulfoferrodoxin [bacterium]